jgi:hypothetical protein
MYEYGLLVKQDYMESIFWLRLPYEVQHLMS